MSRPTTLIVCLAVGCLVALPSFADERTPDTTKGAQIFEDLGGELEDVTLSDLGTAKSVVITRGNTTVINGGGKKAAIQRSLPPSRTCRGPNNSGVGRENPAKRTQGIPQDPAAD